MFLDGISVLEIGDGLAGSASTSFLASLGATVTKIPDPVPEDGALLKDSSTAAVVASLQRRLLDRDKRILAGFDYESVLRDLDPFDVVVVDRVHERTPLLPSGLREYLDYVATRNQNVWVTLSGYGVSGRRAQWVASDLTAAAAGGTLMAVLDPKTNKPIKLAGDQSLLSTGQVAALGALHALDASRRRSSPVHVDVSAQESVIATGPLLRCLQVLFGSYGLSGAKRNGSPAGNFMCRDGVIRISAMEQHQWLAVVRALGDPEWARAYVTSADRVQHAKTIDAKINEWCSTRTKADCEELLQREGVPATATNSPLELLESKQFAARKCVKSFDLNGDVVSAIDLPFRLLEGKEGNSPSPSVEGLSGLRVAEASHVLAMPLAGSILGAMGAEVTKLEDPRRLDMYRRRGPYIDDIEGVDRNVFFPGVNHSKHSRVIDMDDAESLRQILDNSDVLIENLGTGRAQRVGLDYQRLHQERPTLFALSSTGFGQTGPWSRYRAYAYNVLTSSGIGYLTRTANGDPADIDMAWADLHTGFALATLVAAWAVGPHRKRGAAVDFSMVELVSSRANEFLAAASLGVALSPEDGSNHHWPFAPNALFSTSQGSRLIAVSVSNDAEWSALKSVLGNPPELEADEFSSQARRITNQTALDAGIGAFTLHLDGGTLETQLQALGVPASLVYAPDELVVDADLNHQEFFAEVEHPQWGRRRLVGLPWRFFGEPRITISSPPELGDAGGTEVER